MKETVRAFRMWGHLAAELDTLGRLEPLVHPELAACRGEALERLRAAYCGSIGAEFMHIADPQRVRWIAERMEADPPTPDRRYILERLARAELFERFIHARYVGTKRYSLEGSAAVVPLLDAVLTSAAADGAELALIGMSHRGRLNVMTHVVGVQLAHIFAQFEDVEPQSVFGGGDVAYHQGATGEYRTADGRGLAIHLVSNPSHLEAVDPVLMGRARARQVRFGSEGTRNVLPINLHGDAAFSGQGIAAETLNLADLDGMSVGGTVHIVVNNLIGFTTPARFLHSSRYATDVAKRLAVPIFHVNAEDPDAVVRVGTMAAAYRHAFGSDTVVDLIGFRRHGHSEVDDPTVTSPLLYARLAGRKELWRSYAERIGVSDEEVSGLEKTIGDGLREQLAAGRDLTKRPALRRLPDYWSPYVGGRWDPSLEVDTSVPAERLKAVAGRLVAVPKGLRLHPKVKKLLEQRRAMERGERPVDWGMAEALAFGSLLCDGVAVRIAGQDSRRGTFNHRHLVLFDQKTEEEYIPLQHVAADQAWFAGYDTPLSEAAALGFEYGFSRAYPDALVLWEAQFGDFANGAQVIIDQFLTAGEDKWQLLCGLVLLLPHGYEGQGPEHSSARFERFLQLAAEESLQVCQPTTAAQYFHLLRRQVLRRWRKPLVSLAPKGLLRAKLSASAWSELCAGRFRPVLGDPTVESAERVVLCSGRLAYDLISRRDREGDETTAVVRLEQMVPFPESELREELARHQSAREIVWAQEEPANMGGLAFVKPRLDRLAGDRRIVTVKRPASASPATGSAEAHAIEQKALVSAALARRRAAR